MKRFILASLLFSFCFVSVFAGGDDQKGIKLRPEVLDFFRQKSFIKLNTEEQNHLRDFMRAVEGQIPATLFADFNSRGIGYCNGKLRELAENEKEFLRKNIEHVHLLKFLVFLNFENMGLTALPDNFSELGQLGFFSLENNDIKIVPPVIAELQKDQRLIVIALNDNPLPLEDFEITRKKTMEVVYQDNHYSAIKAADLKWRDELKNFTSTDTHTLPNEPTYNALAEIAVLGSLDGFEVQYDEWAASSLNSMRLAHYMQSTSPDKAAQFFADHPDEIFKNTFCGMDTRTQKFKLSGIVLTHLMELDLVEVEGIEIDVSDTLKHKVPRAVLGWTRYFNMEPVNLAEGLWLTAEGIHVLFDLIGLYDRPFTPALLQEDQQVFLNFDHEHDIPFLLSEDIRLYRSIGIRNAQARTFGEIEKAWLKEHLHHLPQLKFLKNISLCGLDLEDIPETYCTFDQLKLLHLRNNNIKTITPTLEKLHDTYEHLVINLSSNPVMDGFADNFSGRELVVYEKFARGRNISGRLARNIKQHKSIGVRNGTRCLVVKVEKEWLLDNLADLPQLTFLIHLNLSNMRLSYLPQSFSNFVNLQTLLLEDNEFTQIPRVLANIRVHNHDFKTYVKGNPLRKNADERFTKAVIEEAEKLKEQKKKNEEKANKDRRKLVLKELLPTDVIIKDLVWNPAFVETLGLGELVKFSTPEYKVRDELQEWCDFWSDCQEHDESQKIHDKALKKVKAQMESEEKAHYQNLKNNRSKYRHAFFELLTHMVDEAQDVITKSAGASSSSQDLTNIENREKWFDDIAKKIMAFSFMCTETPEDFIRSARNEKAFLKEMLAIRKGWNSKVNAKQIYGSTKNFSSVLITYLSKHKKLMPFATQKSDSSISIEHLGYDSYFTKKPEIMKDYKGWFKAEALAELLLSLQMVVKKK